MPSELLMKDGKGDRKAYTIVHNQFKRRPIQIHSSLVPFSDDLCTMNIVRSWREQKAMLKMRFPILRDEDFAYEEGDKESMLARLMAKLNKNKDELESLFAELQLY